jgi:FMN phosphatase YigB (HAD superfamily)
MKDQPTVSFDFDSTILKKEWDEEEGMEVPVGLDPIAAELIEKERNAGNEVIIVTSRYGPKPAFGRDNEDLFEIAYDLSIEDVYFTNGEDKVKTLLDLNVIRHYDDDPHEHKAIKDKKAKIELPTMFLRESKKEPAIKILIRKLVLQELEAYQKKIQKGYVKKRNKYLTTGPQKTGGAPYTRSPKPTRSKSAPPGFGGAEE